MKRSFTLALALLTLTPSSLAQASPAIYPPATSTLRFDHDKHKKPPCITCHPTVKKSISPLDRNLPSEAACRPCHAAITRPATGKAGAKAGCATCHPKRQRLIPARTVHPPANLRFGHRLHLDKGVACGACHAFKEGRRPLPAMKTCVACHDKRGVSGRCVVCHLANKDGRLKTRFATGELRPVRAVPGANHGPGFGKHHARAARQLKKTCDRCHTRTSCLTSCHAGSLRPTSIHSGDYVQRHAMDARRDQPRCSSCHRSQSFCLSCHQRLGVGRETRENGFKPGAGQDFHPPGFTAMQRGPAHHAHSARRNIRTCSSCHRESTCIRCHGSAGRGKAGFSPHAPGFAASKKCSSLSARNRRVCMKCHQAGDAKIECR